MTVTYNNTVESLNIISGMLDNDPSLLIDELGLLHLPCGRVLKIGDSISFFPDSKYTVLYAPPPRVPSNSFEGTPKVMPEVEMPPPLPHPEEALLVEWAKGTASLTVHNRETGEFICNMKPVTDNLDHEYRRKPEPVYEYQWVLEGIARTEFITNEEFENNSLLLFAFRRDDSSKRIREC